MARFFALQDDGHLNPHQRFNAHHSSVRTPVSTLSAIVYCRVDRMSMSLRLSARSDPFAYALSFDALEKLAFRFSHRHQNFRSRWGW